MCIIEVVEATGGEENCTFRAVPGFRFTGETFDCCKKFPDTGMTLWVGVGDLPCLWASILVDITGFGEGVPSTGLP